MSTGTQSSRRATIRRVRSARRSGRADGVEVELWNPALGRDHASVGRFMSPPLLIQLIKSMCILSRRGTRRSCGCVTKLLNWRFCTIKPNKHFQKKCWNSLPPFLAFSPHPPSQTPPLVLEILRVHSPITQCLFMSSTLTKASGKGE